MDKGLLLKRYWFEVENSLGFGVTAYSLEDAEHLLAEAIYSRRAQPLRIVKIVEGVDIRDLDQGHVIPNMGPPNFRGVWFPCLNL